LLVQKGYNGMDGRKSIQTNKTVRELPSRELDDTNDYGIITDILVFVFS